MHSLTRTYILKPSPKPGPSEESFRISYRDELNPAQFEAATILDGPIVCIAGAGSGKTRTLVYRVARMIESGIRPESILLLTFTRKASNQMLSRVVALIGEGGTRVAGGTYHSFAAKTLRLHGHFLGLPKNFSIIDEADSCDIINLARTEMGMNKRETRFPLKQTLREMLSKTINRGRALEDILLEDYGHFLEHADDIRKIFAHYAAYKKENHLLDYDDLLTYLEKLLAESSGAREILENTYRYVLIDEYQDTNLLQARITELLGRKNRNIMIVGDDAQSIYSFRGANFRNIHEFPRVFPEARVIKLEQNYRSTEAILRATNTLMTHAKLRYEKNLFCTRDGGEKPAVIPCTDEAEQAGFIAQRILELREENIKLSDIAVLFRSSFHAFQLEVELKRRQIPYVKWGGFKFLEAAHIRDLLAHLRLLNNPLDFVSWQRALLLVEGVGSKSIPKLFETIKTATNPFDLGSLEVQPRMKAGLTKLGTVLQKAFSAKDSSPSAILCLLSDYYSPLLKTMFDDYPRRLRDLDQFAVMIGRFKTLAEMLVDFALEPPNGSVDDHLAPDDDDQERLILSTIHSAKGLEWHSVFILSTLEGRFPSFAALKKPEDIEEERRLMYVAMTRARENLFITYPVKLWDPITGEVLSRPSRFLDHIGENNLEKWQLVST